MRTMDLKRIILKMFGDKEFYGYEVHKKLVSEDVKVNISRLYRVLNEMLREGLLEGYWERSRFGPRKRVYQLGRKGREELNKILLDAIKTVHSFYGKYLMNLPPKVNPLDDVCNLLTDELKGQGNIGYITPKYSAMHERVIRTLHSKVPQWKLYFIKPNSVQVDLKLDNLLFLDGAYNNISLKKGYLDLLVVLGVPQKDSLATALKEWHRVLRQNGRLAILSPTILIHKYEDPLAIGDFVEKYEYETMKKGEQISKEFLQGLLKNFFNRVEERQIVHMTIFLASEPCSLQ